MTYDTDFKKMVANENARVADIEDRANEAIGDVNNAMANFNPGMIAKIGLAPNPLGRDSNGDGKPDGWVLGGLDGFATCELAFTIGTGNRYYRAEQSAEALEFLDTTGLAPDEGAFVIGPINFWRLGWNFPDGIPDNVLGGPDLDNFVSFDWRQVPIGGQAGCFIKFETPETRAAFRYGYKLKEAAGDWELYEMRPTPAGRSWNVGGYEHPALRFDKVGCPNQGSYIIGLPQAFSHYMPVTKDWPITAGLSRYVEGDGYGFKIDCMSHFQS